MKSQLVAAVRIYLVTITVHTERCPISSIRWITPLTQSFRRHGWLQAAIEKCYAASEWLRGKRKAQRENIVGSENRTPLQFFVSLRE